MKTLEDQNNNITEAKIKALEQHIEFLNNTINCYSKLIDSKDLIIDNYNEMNKELLNN